jgi:hypothetical protein
VNIQILSSTTNPLCYIHHDPCLLPSQASKQQTKSTSALYQENAKIPIPCQSHAQTPDVAESIPSRQDIQDSRKSRKPKTPKPKNPIISPKLPYPMPQNSKSNAPTQCSVIILRLNVYCKPSIKVSLKPCVSPPHSRSKARRLHATSSDGFGAVA